MKLSTKEKDLVAYAIAFLIANADKEEADDLEVDVEELEESLLQLQVKFLSQC